MARIHQRLDMDRSSILFCFVKKTPALGITFFPVSTGRTSQPIPLIDRGFFFAFWPLHRLTNLDAKLFSQGCDPTFSSHWRWSTCIHANCTQMERQSSLRMKRTTRRVSSCRQYSPSFRHFHYAAWVENVFRLHTRYGCELSPFFGAASELPQPALSFSLGVVEGYGFFWCAHMDFHHPIGIFVLGTSTMRRQEDASTQVFFFPIKFL